MKIFRKPVSLNKTDRERLTAAGYLDGWNKLVKLLRKDKPVEDDLKRLVLMELESETPRRPIIEKLIVQIQKRERGEIRKAIKVVCPSLSNV